MLKAAGKGKIKVLQPTSPLRLSLGTLLGNDIQLEESTCLNM